MNHQPQFIEAGPSSYAHHGSYDQSTPMSNFIVSPEMNTHSLPTSHPNASHPMAGHPQGHDMMQYQHMQPHHHGVPTFTGFNYMHMQRHPSIQTTRSESPHGMIGADVFGGPVNTPMLDQTPQGHLQPGYDYQGSESFSSEVPLGISPARALGPAPRAPQPFPTPGSSDSHVTPQPKNNQAPNRTQLLSSSSAGSSADSSSVERPTTRNGPPTAAETSEDENESPTAKRVRDRIPTFETGERNSSQPPKRANTLASRPKAGPSTSRSSAKLTKVAEDPGVEGVPPGPRPMERPPQSFACIIGQAILKSSAGGLSLEHIYRYVETAYPYFKTADQWRNSVRHNLSIHKIFETIQRNEKHPPGKGGIWIINEEEKIHWPSEDKFIKNFQPSHPHYAVCRQTKHEQAQEKKLRAKAEAEGKQYIPKKGKRAKMHKQEDLKKAEPLMFPPPRQQHQMVPPPLPPNMHPAPLPSNLHHQPGMPPQVPMAMGIPPVPQPPIRGPPHHMQAMPMAHSQSPPPPPSRSGSQNRFDFEDDSDFVPDDSKPKIPPLRFPESTKEKRKPLALHPTMGPPRGLPGQENKPPIVDDEGVFSNGGPRKRNRAPDAEPLSPVPDQQLEQADMTSFLDADMFITPSRERPSQPSASVTESARMLTSSALKTPALVQTSSSPTSSPMPPTVTRGANHHPSALQQAWTEDDMVHTSNSASSPARLEAAFDLKPTPKKERLDDDFQGLAPRGGHNHGVPPKTPVTRSSAAAALDRTPRASVIRTPLLKTPLTYGSPARVFSASNNLMSTPFWEMNGILERLKNDTGSPSRTPRGDHPPASPTHYSRTPRGDRPPTSPPHYNRTPRGDRPPTSPTHYSLSDAGDSPIAKRRKVTTTSS